MTERTGRRKGGGRDGRREARENTVVEQAAFIERKIPYFEYLSEGNLQLIEDNADILLEETELAGKNNLLSQLVL